MSRFASYFQSPKDFYGSLKPTFFISTLMGIFPMLPLNSRQLYTSWKLQVISAVTVTVYCLCFAVTILKRSNNVVGGKFYTQRNKVSNFGLTFQFLSGFIIFYAIFAASFLRTKKVHRVMVDLNEVDGMLKRIGQKFRYVRDFWYQILIIATGMMTIVSIARMQMYNLVLEHFPPITSFMWVVFLHPVALLNQTNSMFAFTALLIYDRFRMVNDQLERIETREMRMINTKSGYSAEKSDEKTIHKVQSLSRIHDILCECANKTNTNYNIPMAPILTHQFFLALYVVFYYYWMHSSKPLSAFLWLCWGFLKLYEMFHVAVACHVASREAEIVGKRIHKILISNRNETLEEKLLTFSQQVHQHKFKFTLCGLFNIDASLIFNMIGSSTTFIVIMIQFQEAVTPTVCTIPNYSNVTV